MTTTVQPTGAPELETAPRRRMFARRQQGTTQGEGGAGQANWLVKLS
jgi:hypothetical protein